MLEKARRNADLAHENGARRRVEPDLASFVDAARRRLGQLSVRTALRRSLGIALVVAGACAGARPLLWASLDAMPSRAFVRAVVFALVPLVILSGVVAVRAWRGRSSLLAAARAVDHELGLAEVVASGFAFERDRRDDAMSAFAIARARRAIEGVVVGDLFAWKPQPRSKRGTRWLAAGATSIALGLAVGTLDGAVVERIVHPATKDEVAAAAELARSVETIAKEPSALPAEQRAIAERMVDAARRASEAAARGDRGHAREALEEMREAARALEAAQRQRGRSLRALRDEIEGKSKGSSPGNEGGRSATASEAMAKLAKELELASGDEAMRKMLERLERAEASARSAAKASNAAGSSETSRSPSRGGETASAWSRAATALREAREAAARGDSEGAKRAMATAEREMAGLERMGGDPSSAGRMTRMADGASELARSMHLAMSSEGASNKGGEAGAEKGSGADAPASRANSEKGGPTGTPGGAGGRGENAGAEQRRVNVEGNLQARGDPRAGERAVSAIQGMGRGDDHRAYAEIFPSYDTVVEDGLREDVVPAAKQSTVRRYFSSIRPGSETDESRN